MRSPHFWWIEKSLSARLLAPAAYLYAAIADRPLGGGERTKIPVICIGNFVAGGAGKTPLALHVAKLLKDKSLTVAFLTRGYGGALKGPHRVLADDKVDDVGDEPMLLSGAADTIVSKDRVAGLHHIEGKIKPDIIIMDDGFQSAKIKPDFSLIVVDSARGIGSGRVIPAGPLRASFEKQLQIADAVFILMGASPEHPSIDHVVKAAKSLSKPVFHGELTAKVDEKYRQSVAIAYSGIGHPDKFFDSLRAGGVTLIDRVAFPDHHQFTHKEAEHLLKLARERSAHLLTTEKDAARLKHQSGSIAQLREQSIVVPASTSIKNEGELEKLLIRLAEPIS